ncbi:hypothetical protein RND71_007895 [Anisodus tanguticus]|uniref:Inosine/uridine-preferring nucleoside hydrolase domain-containing protein n=1 Tax=Anisodus tanguticus TaxID=243964 RepID=A0AAE1SMR3_9SOLA|nr:hypothetical protein RND71_007895 [Anisodus tanguticus]
MWIILCVSCVIFDEIFGVKGLDRPHRILVDTDMDTDDFFALLYLLKLNRSQMDLQAITISTNAWSDAGHAVNQVYDMLYMMGRDDVAVGVGSGGGLLPNGTILPDVGGYLPIIDQGNDTAGYCRYRQAIPVGPGGRLDIDSNFGFKRASFHRLYNRNHFQSSTFLFISLYSVQFSDAPEETQLDTYPQSAGWLNGKRHYSPLRQPTVQQVMINTISSGPTVVFLIASHTNFALFLLSNPHLKRNIERIYIMGGGVRSKNPTGCCPKNFSPSCQPQQCGDIGNLFTDYTSNPYAEFNFFMDPFAAYQLIHSGIPVTLVPLDATNTIPVTEKFIGTFQKNQHTYEAQYCFKSLKMARDTWFDDQFNTSYFMRESFMSGVAASIMRKQHSQHGENDFSEMEYINITIVTSNKPYGISDGSNPIFDGPITPKFSVARNGVHTGHVQTKLRDPFCIEKNRRGRCQAIIVSPTGWTNAATIDSVYDLLHMMGRDDIPVGLGDVFAMNQSDPVFYAIGDCKYNKVIPQGCGGFLDSDTLWFISFFASKSLQVYGLASVNHLPKGETVDFCKNMSILYTAENSVKYGSLRDTDHPELGQPLALEVLGFRGNKGFVLKWVWADGGRLGLVGLGLADFGLISGENMTKVIQARIPLLSLITNEVVLLGFAELNMFLDPPAAQTVLSSHLNITLIPLGIQQKVSVFPEILQRLNLTKRTPEAIFARRLLSRLHHLQKTHPKYQHMDTFLGEILGAVVLAGDYSVVKSTFAVKNIKVTALGRESEDGQMIIDEKQGKSVKELENLDPLAYYDAFANRLGDVSSLQ